MKEDYVISEISLEDTQSFMQSEHYLEDIFGKKSQWITHKCYGLFQRSPEFNHDKLVGAVQYCSYNFGGDNKIFHQEHYGCHTEDCEGFWEIARLAVSPLDEHNITSWFLSRTIKMINAKVIVTVADKKLHEGTIYSATNFDYYGWMQNRVYGDEVSAYHVYLKTFDKNIECEWEKKT